MIDFVISPIEFAYQGLLYASFRFPSCHGLYTRLTLGSCIHDFPLMSCNIYGFEDICRLSVSLDAVSRKAIQCIIILRDVRMAPRLSFSVLGCRQHGTCTRALHTTASNTPCHSPKLSSSVQADHLYNLQGLDYVCINRPAAAVGSTDASISALKRR